MCIRDSYIVGNTIANDGSWPNWMKTSAFRAKRDAMMAAKK